MKKSIYLLLILSISFSSLLSQIKKSKASKWISKIDYSKSPKKDNSYLENGVFSLLYEHQINETNKEFYYRYATKILENTGVQSSSSINILYDPTYQELTFNSIYIIRDGKYIDKLKTTDFQLVRRELNSENYVYDGTLSAMTNLSDVRVGDIIEYSYTIKGENPIYKNNFFYSFYLNDYQPLSKIYLSIITNKNLDFHYINTEKKFNKNFFYGKNKYEYSNSEINLTEYDNQIPSWKFQYEMAFVSEFKTWKEVVDWGTTVFNVNKSLSKALLKKIDKIKNTNKTDGEKINETLNFVQNEVRYLGLESGIGAYKPFTSNKVYDQLYGDCKDKSLLMTTMLNEMGIEAYPMLVNTYLKKTITTLPPSPTLFDHCVVKVIDKKAGVLYYDPTISNQGGAYDVKSFPDYKFGLVLKKGKSELDELYSLANNKIEITDFYKLDEVGKGATLKTTSIYFDDEADFMRSYFKNNSINSIQKEYEKFYSNYFYNIKTVSSPTYKDNLKENKFTTFEEYRIDSIWENTLDDKNITVGFQPYSIINAMVMPQNRERNNLFSLTYPLNRTQIIKVKLPEKWNIENENYTIDSPNFFYDFDVRYREKQDLLTISHTLKNLKDHVTISEFEKFYDDVKKLDTSIVYSLLIAKDYVFGSSTSANSWLTYLGIIIFIIVFFVAIFLAIKVYGYDPEVKIESYFEENKSIGGWLILVGIGLSLSPFWVLANLLTNEGIFINGTWINFFNSSSGLFNIKLGFIVFFELVVNTFLFVFLILYIFLFFKKRTSFPKLYSFTLIGVLVFTILDTIIVNWVSDLQTSSKEIGEIVGSAIRTGVIASYLLISDNVKETFVRRIK